MTGTKRKRGGIPGVRKRLGRGCLTVVVFLLLLTVNAGAQTRKVRVSDARAAQELIQHGGKLVADYGSFQLIQTDASHTELGSVQTADEPDVIELNSTRINTSSTPRRTSPADRKSVV